MPTAVLRRYTPPTCTLEIAAARSALSRWTDRTVLKGLQFHLSFDDPKLMPDQQITISGDRSQLEVLSETVGDYVQTLLNAAPEQIAWEAPLRFQNPLPQQVESVKLEGISVEPKGLLSHDLHLGSLATEESGAVVHLTTLQLFDLANALEEYSAESMSLPASSRLVGLPQMPKNWASVAAVAVLALGATGALGKFVLDIAKPTVQTASAPRERQVDSELNSELFPQMSPPPIESSPTVTLQPLPPPPPDGAAQSNSPGLPPVGVTQAPVTDPSPVLPGIEPGATAPNSANSTASGQQLTVIPDPTVATAPAAPSAQSNTPPRLTGIEAPSEAPAPAAAASRAAAGADAPSTTTANSSTAFDTIPQVAEVRSYFQQNWQPPAELTQTLEYRLLLNADGSLQRIVPLGQMSENYIDRTNMPLMGEPFVSPTGDGRTPQIRLVLKPDGKVQSFLEYAN